MKLSTLMLASLMTLTSAAAFAEGGSERSKEFYNNFTFMQNQLHSTNERVAAADGKDMKMDTVEETNTDQQPKS
ncbi:hypothetical protein GIW50_12310 [Pseudomonas syringae]|uniref:Secreted protein n=1 Tax=Pseudomonas syringae TaxID=317 RepID=A0A9Q3X2G9_PSESX|nr:hypothetical protein [Pseudomonas syringae]MCF5063013.1 hypothetical protein [Pseudomonas syringae]MCF5076069.1 hypothetical protein [Pseudomonas syringae]MCF5119185.1 hypothetical protein [Pseudomonas syringae]MCF5379357.1 hypothetical protein [Pseudomonas syringae]